jgi:arabinose-5-phosphate isomerase
MDPSSTASVLVSMRNTLRLEMEGLESLASALDDEAVRADVLIRALKGRVIAAGVGKSGHVARKIAATLASTGTPALYVHPAEASHGDLGMVTKDDCVIALSKSGETRELSDMIAYCRRFSIPLIAMTSMRDSTLARAADILLALPDAPEACGETRAPTTSTTLMMALGDALAVALIEARGFTAKDFARFHPGGALGAALASVDDIMHAGDAMPLAGEGDTMGTALIEMSAKGFGCVGVVGTDGRLVGIVTDGDLRRHMDASLPSKRVDAVMTQKPATVVRGALASDAMRLMTEGERKITQLFVCEPGGAPAGLLHIHDLLRIGVS